MKNIRFCLTASIALLFGAPGLTALADTLSVTGTVAQWNFDTLGAVAVGGSGTYNDNVYYPNNPPFTTDGTQDNNNYGEPFATSLGMSNSFAYISSGSTIAVGSVPACDITSTGGLAASGSYTANAWRIRGPASNGYNVTSGTPTGTGNGWNLCARNTRRAPSSSPTLRVSTTSAWSSTTIARTKAFATWRSSTLPTGALGPLRKA